ncbi:DUF6894 family protein [Microvirga makkahensis]|uniref:DUF6894 family protein n=1 Tax=Microvirga makkahensis TaxID=1128670 RepID=UPI003CCE1FBF
MPRFYRHIRQGGRLIQDPDEIELPGLAATRAEALGGIRDVLAEAIRHGADDALDDAIVPGAVPTTVDADRQNAERLRFSTVSLSFAPCPQEKSHDPPFAAG